MSKYTLYIDESGQAGISRIRSDSVPGASPYMTLGGVLVRNQDKEHLANLLEKIAECIGKEDLHCNGLRHEQKVYFAREVSKQEIVLFGVISKKSTLGWYGSMIGSNHVKYYNKCGQYLLERVGKFVGRCGIDKVDVDIVFEEGVFDYGMFRGLIRACQNNPRHVNTRQLQNISTSKIVAARKNDEPLLKMADLVAHALYKAVDKVQRNYSIPEPRYLTELGERFCCEDNGENILLNGLMAIHDLGDLELDADVREAIENLRGDLLLP